MATIKIASTAANDVSEATLKNAPPRMLTFLQGIADPAIGAQLAPLGWSEERLEQAWALLNELKAVSVVAPVVTAVSVYRGGRRADRVLARSVRTRQVTSDTCGTAVS